MSAMKAYQDDVDYLRTLNSKSEIQRMAREFSKYYADPGKVYLLMLEELGVNSA